MKFICGLIFLLNCSMIHANPQSVIWYTQGENKQVNLNVDFFMSSACSHCIKADVFLRELEKEKPWLVVHRYVINQDKMALQTFYDRLQAQHLTSFTVPAIFFCGSRWNGFKDKNTTGKVLLQALTLCHNKIVQDGELTPATISVLQKGGDASEFQFGPSMTQSASVLIISTALMDAMSPCSFFCFAAFLAFLWLYPTEKWLQFSIGLLFILSLAFIHYVQQVNATFYYQMIPKFRLVEPVIGLVLFLVFLTRYRKLSGWFTLKSVPLIAAVVIFTVFAIQITQQTCAFNVAMVFEQWWSEHPLSSAIHLIYLVVYQFFYVLPMVVILLFSLIFGRHARLRSFQQKLIVAAYFMLMSIGILLIISPQLLANVLMSIVVPLTSIIAGWYIVKKDVLIGGNDE